MIKLWLLLVAMLKIGGLTVYGLHTLTKTPQLSVKRLEKPKRELATGYNQFVNSYPNRRLKALTKQLQWLLENDYQRNPRVRRILHQDLKNLMDMAKLKEKLSEPDPKVDALLDSKIDEVMKRITAIRRAKDEAVKEEILIHAELIDFNGKR